MEGRERERKKKAAEIGEERGRGRREDPKSGRNWRCFGVFNKLPMFLS